MDAHKEHPFSNMDALRFGWDATMANLKPLLLLGLVAAFLSLLHQGLAPPYGARGLAPLLALVVQVLQVGVAMVYVRWSLMLVDDQAMDTRSAVLFHDFFGFLLTAPRSTCFRSRCCCFP
jgi:hypothetical protein